ncbi:MAG: ankyrin repeat domain-containing protein, partial [Candidatus Poseidoniia archaeon]
TALHWAAHWDDLPTANALIAAGGAVGSANDYGVTPLFLAASNGSAAMLDVLLEAGANPNAAVSSGETALMAAVRSGSLASVNRLIARRADVNAKQTSKGQTALMWAATRLRTDIVQALLDGGADVAIRSASGFSPLMFGAREGGIELSRLLVAAGDDVNASSDGGNTPLLVATVRGHAELAMFLLEQGAQPDGDFEGAGYTPLHWASSTAETPLTYAEVEAPGEWRAMPGIPDRAAKLTLIQMLIEHGADLEATLARPLLAYSTFENRSHRGGTPFYTAAASGDAEVMRLLVAHGADPLARAGNEWTPIMAASGAFGNQTPNIEAALSVTEQDRVDAIELAWKLG